MDRQDGFLHNTVLVLASILFVAYLLCVRSEEEIGEALESEIVHHDRVLRFYSVFEFCFRFYSVFEFCFKLHGNALLGEK
ncbi:unnamed protein product [Brassica oleracea]